MPSSASCQRSPSPTSAAATPNSLRTRFNRPETICRFDFSDPLDGRCSTTRSTPTDSDPGIPSRLKPMLDAALKRAQGQRAQAEQDFKELLAIPSVSSLTRHRADCRRAAEWTVERLKAMGMEVELADVVADGHPVISAHWLQRPGKPTLTIYGHYDVQPPDPLDEWETPPFEPTVRDGRLYARGAGDNKGQYLSSLKAAEYAFAEGGPPINLRFLIEGEEEITGPSLPTFVTKNADRLKTDYLFIADGSFFTQQLPAIVTALRGILYTEIEAVGAEADLHSGIYGGIAPNPLNALAQIIAALKGPDGRITIPGFYDAVRPPSPEE